MDVNSKDKFLIELPASIDVPPAVFKVEVERGRGANHVKRYRTAYARKVKKRSCSWK